MEFLVALINSITLSCFEDDAGEGLKRYTIPSQSGCHTTASSHVKGAFRFASEDRSWEDNLAGGDRLRISRKGSGRKMNSGDDSH
jgi:hypothetical protein